jgi:hypothetical protein
MRRIETERLGIQKITWRINPAISLPIKIETKLERKETITRKRTKYQYSLLVARPVNTAYLLRQLDIALTMESPSKSECEFIER